MCNHNVETAAEFIKIVAPSLVAIGVAVIPIGWAWQYDRYKKLQDKQEYWESWINALGCEADHQINTLHELQEIYKEIMDSSYFGVFTKRFNEDLFKLAREQVVATKRSKHIFPILTRTYRDTDHTNLILDRYERFIHENSASLHKLHKKNIPILQTLGKSFEGLENTLKDFKKILDDEVTLFASNRPKLFWFSTPKDYNYD